VNFILGYKHCVYPRICCVFFEKFGLYPWISAPSAQKFLSFIKMPWGMCEKQYGNWFGSNWSGAKHFDKIRSLREFADIAEYCEPINDPVDHIAKRHDVALMISSVKSDCCMAFWVNCISGWEFCETCTCLGCTACPFLMCAACFCWNGRICICQCRCDGPQLGEHDTPAEIDAQVKRMEEVLQRPRLLPPCQEAMC
jgi:hypothetical protein